MEGSLLLPLSDGLVIEQISPQAQHLLVSARATTESACCPVCVTVSASLHSHYLRTIADLPHAGQQVILRLRVRRFYCRNPLCPRRIFSERLAEFVQPWAQMTNRLREALCALSFATSAEAASCLAPRLGMKSSPSTLLRCQKAVPLAQPSPFTKIGLDDFAFRRGRTYGTLIVNLETHRLIEVLPDRTVATVTAWLSRHPEIELISRDRASDYATAATLGAPQATQVCDRWHLVKNLSEYVMNFLARMRAQVRDASQKSVRGEEEAESSPLPSREQAVEPSMPASHAQKKTSLELAAEARKAQRLDLYRQVIELYERGLRSPEIAPRVGVSDRTVRRLLVHGIETSQRRKRPSPLDRYASYLHQRWKEGEQNGLRLLDELRMQGYTGSQRAFYRYIKRWRLAVSPSTSLPSHPSPPPPPRKKQPVPPPGPFDACQAKQAIWLYMRTPEKLTATEKEQLAFLKGVHPSLETAYDLVQAFLAMVHARPAEKLEDWLDKARHCEIPELIRFAKGIERDKAPVQAALQLPYSNGVVEGHVHRLKLIKRQGYGRASFPLLRQRVLYQAE